MSSTTQPQSEEFRKAVAESDKIVALPEQGELLSLYGLYKQGIQNPPIEQAPAPGMMDIKGKAKKKAWQKIVGEGTTPEEAQIKYVELVEHCKNVYGYDPNKVKR
ncbi:MAG: hypothetical protein M1830_008472 [Pleopsidium flavum]|nr:MAG: hypothetical protein M1830_008472 [Pleopsidium flavum]